jgi:hypothetical protein
VALSQAQKNLIAREKQIRQQRIEARAGSRLIYTEDAMINLILLKRINTSMQHCVIKVMTKVQGGEKDKFLSAFNICGAVFEKYGYQKSGEMRLTSKGLRNNMRHRSEVDAGFKESRYDSLQERVWGASLRRAAEEKRNPPPKDSPPGGKPPGGSSKTVSSRERMKKED